MYEIVLSKQADKTLRKMPRNLSKRIQEKLQLLASDPFAPNHNVTNLQNRDGFRLRVGDWRIIYEIVDDQLILLVLRIAARGAVY